MSTKDSPIYNPPLTPHYNYWYEWYKSQDELNAEKQKLHEELMKLVRDVMPETTPAPPKAEEPEWLTDPDVWYTDPTPCWTDETEFVPGKFREVSEMEWQKLRDGCIGAQGGAFGLAPTKNEGTCEGYSSWVDLLSHEEHKEDAEDKEIDLRHEISRTYMYPGEGFVRIEAPTYLLFDKDGNHIVEDAKCVYEIAPGWLAIRKEY